MKEPEQEQAIESIQKFSAAKKHVMDDDYGWLVRYEDHKQIVDSQAQKIKSMEDNYRELAGAWFDEKEALGIRIAQLTKERDDARKCAEDSRDDEYDNDIDLSLAENRLMRREYAKAHPLPWEKQ